jgi:DNA polymerase I
MLENGQDVGVGSIISFVVRNGEGMVRDRSFEVEAFIKAGYKYDSDYYIDNQVLPAVMRILKGFGYTEETLKFSKHKQMTLGDFF